MGEVVVDAAVPSARSDAYCSAVTHPTKIDGSAIGLEEAIWYVAVLGVVALTGIINLYRPLYGDSALFLLAAEGMSRGDVLYVDFWDNKQPGIFAFYYVAGRLFGFTAPGLHLFELCWMLWFSVVLCIALRPCLRWRWLGAWHR